ncbi:MAG: hypothetical protein FWG64_10925, partial [Firmicutes bacterium]|nr:hypothetical protein [Bacillota bacterium]
MKTVYIFYVVKIKLMFFSLNFNKNLVHTFCIFIHFCDKQSCFNAKITENCYLKKICNPQFSAISKKISLQKNFSYAIINPLNVSKEAIMNYKQEYDRWLADSTIDA